MIAFFVKFYLKKINEWETNLDERFLFETTTITAYSAGTNR